MFNLCVCVYLVIFSRLETQRPAVNRGPEPRDRGWWSGGLMSMWEPARRSFRCGWSLSNYTHPQMTDKKLVLSMAKWPFVENLYCFFSVSFSISQTPTPKRMRILVWIWMSLSICRNWMRWEVQCSLERLKRGNNWSLGYEVVHVWPCKILNIQFLCNDIEDLFMFSDQCCWRAGVECELQSHSDFWRWSLPPADLLSAGKSSSVRWNQPNIH